ncbi:MAG: PEGA domain-containing protein [Deltaproteobacteria bacterium]|jgi:tetratricopeptide (TPR) repeat protein|nr:PEGA domain-containing protein [Deltaproteobacteria bacterium]
MKFKIIIIVLLSVLFVPGAVEAQSASKIVAKAKQMYLQAEKLYVKGKFAQALDKYMKAHEFSNKPGLLFNIAQCHRNLKQYEKARFFYKLFLDKLPNNPYKSEVKQHIVELENNISEQKNKVKNMGRVSIITKPKGAGVLVDSFSGQPRSLTPVVLHLTPGTHLIVVKKEGYESISKKVEIKKNKLVFLNLDLGSEKGEAKSKTAKKRIDSQKIDKNNLVKANGSSGKHLEPDKFYNKWWFYTGIATTLVFVSGSVYFGMEAVAYEDDYNNATSQADKEHFKDEGETAALRSDISTGIAVLSGLATVAGSLIYHNYFSSPKSVSSKTSSYFVIPSCTSAGCTVSASFSF